MEKVVQIFFKHFFNQKKTCLPKVVGKSLLYNINCSVEKLLW